MSIFVPKDRKSLFRQFLSGMYDAVVITDPVGHILEINTRAEEHFGYIQDEVVDKPISFYIPGLSPQIVERIRKGLSELRHMMIDANAKAKDGRKIACEVTVSMIDLMNPGDLVFTIRNVERRRRMISELRAKASAFEIAGAALFSCDEAGKFLEINEFFLKLFGLDEDEARERTFGELMNDDPLPENFKQALAGKSSKVSIAAESDGETKEELEISLAPYRDGRKVIGVVGSILKVR